MIPSQDESTLRHYISQEDKDDSVFVVFEEENFSIPKSQRAHGKSTNVLFPGACIDTGAQKSVVGKEQALAYFKFIGEEFKPSVPKRKLNFKFGNRRHVGLGRVEVRNPINETRVLCPYKEVVDVDIPLLLGLDFLGEYKMNVDAGNDILESKSRAWSFPLTRKLGHLYLEWEYKTFYTSEELLKVHNHFFHPESGRLYSMLKRADDGSTSSSDLTKLEKISSECDVCQRNRAAASRLWAVLPPDDVVFNRCLCMYIMFLEGKAVLHMVDKDTKFSAAVFLQQEIADEL